MPEYRITASFDLATTVEPDGAWRLIREIDNATEVEDSSYFSEQPVTCDGGEILFTVEAEDEYDAEAIAHQSLYDGKEWEDNSGLTWCLENVRHEIEAVEPEPPTVEEAVAILDNFVATTERGSDEYRVAQAAKVVLDDHARLASKVEALEARLEEHSQRLAGLEARLLSQGAA